MGTKVWKEFLYNSIHLSYKQQFHTTLHRCYWGEHGEGKDHGEREIEKWEQSRELGFKLGFVSFFLFPVLGPVSIEVGDPQVGEVTCGGSPHLSCKRDQIKMRDYYGQAGYPT